MPRKTNDEDFYSDLDQQKYKPSMGCGSLAIFLLFIFLAGSYIVYWSITQIKAKVNTSSVGISQVALEQAEAKLKSFLKGDQGQNQPITVSFTNQELTSLLVKNEILAQTDSVSLKDPSVIVDSSGLFLSGTLVKPITTKITASSQPYIDNGILKLKVQEVKAGKLVIPGIFNKQIQTFFERLVTSRLNNNSIVYDSVTLEPNLLTLTGHTR